MLLQAEMEAERRASATDHGDKKFSAPYTPEKLKYWVMTKPCNSRHFAVIEGGSLGTAETSPNSVVRGPFSALVAYGLGQIELKDGRETALGGVWRQKECF